MHIVCLSTGRPQQLRDYHDEPFVSAIRRTPVAETLWLSSSGLAGDQVALTDVHGGPNRALHLFCHDNYAFFNYKAGFDLPVPAFGENLTVSGYDEQCANVGDVLRLGEALIQVAHPTERCGKIGQSLGLPKMLKWIHEELYTGFYCRVLQEGMVAHDSIISLEEQGPALLNVARLNRLLFKEPDRAALDTVLCEDLLSAEWKQRAKELYARADR
ncbi:MAG: MOSC domain-containing protein [Gammaproteobacteria bacterium]|nr:MOSC domain-containing protein [Gammaproteobacteria bacterium]